MRKKTYKWVCSPLFLDAKYRDNDMPVLRESYRHSTWNPPIHEHEAVEYNKARR